jgi:hypothetical protein
MANTVLAGPPPYVVIIEERRCSGHSSGRVTTMTIPTQNEVTARIDAIFAAVIGVCADFCAEARQGGSVPSIPTSLAGRRP